MSVRCRPGTQSLRGPSFRLPAASAMRSKRPHEVVGLLLDLREGYLAASPKQARPIRHPRRPRSSTVVENGRMTDPIPKPGNETCNELQQAHVGAVPTNATGAQMLRHKICDEGFADGGCISQPSSFS